MCFFKSNIVFSAGGLYFWAAGEGGTPLKAPHCRSQSGGENGKTCNDISRTCQQKNKQKGALFFVKEKDFD